MVLTIPYSAEFSVPLEVDMRIGMDATFKDDGNNFTLMLLCDKDNDMADALLIVEADGSTDVKLSYRKDRIKGDPQTIPVSAWHADKILKLFIKMDRDYFTITLNGEFTKTYRYNFSLKMVKNIWIDGDINLNKVTMPHKE